MGGRRLGMVVVVGKASPEPVESQKRVLSLDGARQFRRPVVVGVVDREWFCEG